MENLAKSIRAELNIKRPDISEVTTIMLRQNKIILITPESRISIRDGVTFYIASIDIKTCRKYVCFVHTTDEIINLLRLGRRDNTPVLAASFFGIVFAFAAIIYVWGQRSPDIDVAHLYFTILSGLGLIFIAILYLCDPASWYGQRIRRLASRRKYVKNSALPIPIRNEILAYL